MCGDFLEIKEKSLNQKGGENEIFNIDDGIGYLRGGFF